MPWVWVLAGLGAALVVKQATVHWSTKVAGQWGPLILLFGGRVVPVPALRSPELGAFARFLRQSGVTMWGADELARPHHPSIAREYGITWLIPPLIWWHRYAAIVLAGQATASRATDGPVDARNVYRPEPYNSRVGGEPASYHVDSTAIDLDFASVEDRRRAEAWIRRIYCKHRGLELGLGVGRRTLHLDLLGPDQAPPGFRKNGRPWQWAYGSGVNVTEGRIPC